MNGCLKFKQDINRLLTSSEEVCVYRHDTQVNERGSGKLQSRKFAVTRDLLTTVTSCAQNKQ